jgi:hypothetical protein
MHRPIIEKGAAHRVALCGKALACGSQRINLHHACQELLPKPHLTTPDP